MSEETPDSPRCILGPPIGSDGKKMRVYEYGHIVIDINVDEIYFVLSDSKVEIATYLHEALHFGSEDLIQDGFGEAT